MKFCVALIGGAISVLGSIPAFAGDIDLDKVPEVAIASETVPFYLKGYVGVSMADADHLDKFPTFGVDSDYHWKNKSDMDDAFLGGVGLGYRMNDIVRLDGTVEYHAKNKMSARDQSFSNIRKYEGNVSSIVLMANAYADLVTYHNATPYIGAGIGTSANRMNDFEVDAGSDHYETSSKTNWDIAWAIHAGVGIKLSRNVVLDIGYSYSDLGDAKTGDFSKDAPLKLDHLTSHDVKVGIRYAFK